MHLRGTELSFTLAFKVVHGLGLEVTPPMFTETTVQKTAESQTGCVKIPPAASSMFFQTAFPEAAPQMQGIANGSSSSYWCRWAPSLASHFPSPFIQPSLSGLSLAAHSWVVANKSYGDEQGLVGTGWSSHSVLFREMRVNKEKSITLCILFFFNNFLGLLLHKNKHNSGKIYLQKTARNRQLFLT